MQAHADNGRRSFNNICKTKFLVRPIWIMLAGSQEEPHMLEQLRQVDNRRLYQQIADQIRTLIREGNFPVGSRLPPERDLAQQLGVSRPSVREALIALEVEGYVEVRVGSGVYVVDRATKAEV